ncbi:MAG: glycosyltransferase [Bacteroidota bacterium]
MTILFFPDIGWKGLHQRPHHIAKALSKHWHVIWIEPATLIEKSHRIPTEVGKNIRAVSFPFIPYNARNPFIRMCAKLMLRIALIRKIITALQRKHLVKILAPLLPPNESVGVIIQNVLGIDLLRGLKPTFLLYDYIDNIFGFTRLPQYIITQWKQTISQANLVTVTSPVLKKQIEPFCAAQIDYVGNGVEYDFFTAKKNLTPPQDLPAGKPIVAYIGAVYPWLDYGMIMYGAEKMPDVNFVLIGRTHPDINRILEQMKSYKNIHILGFKPYNTIPSYLNHCSVGIIPFQKNLLTASVNPVKFYEYSAGGVPTVATDFSEDICQFPDLVYLVKSKEEFPSQIRKAMDRTKDEEFIGKLQTFARMHDWKSKTEIIIRHIQQLSRSSQ